MAPQIVACTVAVFVTGWGSAQGEAVECLGDPAIRFPDTQSCLDESLSVAGQRVFQLLGSWESRDKDGQVTFQGWLVVTR